MKSVIRSLASTLRVGGRLPSADRQSPRRCTPTLRLIAALLVVSSSIGNKCAEAQSPANLLLVVNNSSAASGTIARYYAEHRGVPQDNICSITTAATESIARDVYVRQIEQPIWSCITSLRGHDRILYIVLTKDVPIRISGTGGRAGTNASVDSELTLLYRRRTGQAAPIAGFASAGTGTSMVN